MDWKGKKKSRSRSKRIQPELKCFNFHEKGHFKRDCLTENNMVGEGSNNVSMVSYGYESSRVLEMSNIQVGME